MSVQKAVETPLPLAWPLAGSLSLTAAVVAFVCMPPSSHQQSWMAIFTRATLYLLAAGFVHGLAIWGVCRVRDETEDAGLPMIWAAIWTAWLVVVWLPLVALLTAEHSWCVAIVLPLTAVFATLLLKWSAAQRTAYGDLVLSHEATVEPFQLLHVAPGWRLLLPAFITSIAAQTGAAMFAGGHAWLAGCLFCVGTIYPVGRWLGDAIEDSTGGELTSHRTAAANSLLVWLLLVLALVPFMALYASGAVSSLLGIHTQAATRIAPPTLAHSKSKGYSGIILTQPRKPHEIVRPTLVGVTAGSIKETRVIPFDGAYWYFKEPDTRPAPSARVVQGDPAKQHIFSTDREPLMMEAHQGLGSKLLMSCCRSLRVEVTNADNVPGKIFVEVLLRDGSSPTRSTSVSLGTIVLASSTVSPMPLKRAPVNDAVVFQLPHEARGRSFDEITVRIKPERSRSLAGTQVAIKDFVLQH